MHSSELSAASVQVWINGSSLVAECLKLIIVDSLRSNIVIHFLWRRYYNIYLCLKVK